MKRSSVHRPAGRRRGLALVGVVALVSLACTREANSPPALEGLNVLLVVLDTVGAEHVGFENPALHHTPNLDRLASEGVAFRRAYSPAPWTQPAVASLLTSQMPSTHGLISLFGVLDNEQWTLAELLRERGFETAGFISHRLLGARYGFAQGFDHYDEENIGGHRDITGATLTDAVIDWLDHRHGPAPFFVLAHYFDAHAVYHHHPEHDLTSGYEGLLRPGMDIWELRNKRSSLTAADVGYLVGLYDEEIAYTDFHVGRLLDHLRRLGLDETTLVIVVGDHGEEFMRHGWIGHTRTLYDELLHVPLVFRLPGVLAPREVDTPVSLIDVVPTVLALGDRPPTGVMWEGLSLWPLLDSEAQPGDAAAFERDLYAEVSFAPEFDRPRHLLEKAAYKTALRRGPLKLIHDLSSDRYELYDVSVDREELADLAGRDPEGSALRSRLLEWEATRGSEAAASSALSPSEQDLEQLRSLGYVE
jgi:arylsulfatase A-like enzyme